MDTHINSAHMINQCWITGLECSELHNRTGIINDPFLDAYAVLAKLLQQQCNGT